MRLASGLRRAEKSSTYQSQRFSPHGLAVGVLAAAEEVVAEAEVGAEAGDADARPRRRNTRRRVVSAQRCGGLAVRGKRDAERGRFDRDVVANPAAPALGELDRMRGRQDAVRWDSRARY